MKYLAINGFNRQRMKELIRKNNNGTPALHSQVHENDDGEEVISSGFCTYFDKETGNRCAVGCFLTDDFIEMEKETVSEEEMAADDLLNKYPVLAQQMPLGVEGLMAMQQTHDACKENGSEDVREVLCKWIDENVLDEGEYENNDCDDDGC